MANVIFDVLAPPVDNRQRNHHYPQLSAKEEIKSPAIVVKTSCNTLLTSLKRSLFNKEITVIQAQFSVDYGNMRPFSALRGTTARMVAMLPVSTRQMPGRVASRNLQSGFFFAPPCFSPPSQRLGRKA
ncbi:hypothetical protein H7U18_28635 [Klebsiella pneumoniae]|uniref:Uncharacterized protein n=1 Tax=Klebsiella pneumoniae TaxID=573 RepID=A0A923EMS0_KLEPN|nr:hypothetical protein [Klebsiella pneumoniae]